MHKQHLITSKCYLAICARTKNIYSCKWLPYINEAFWTLSPFSVHRCSRLGSDCHCEFAHVPKAKQQQQHQHLPQSFCPIVTFWFVVCRSLDLSVYLPWIVQVATIYSPSTTLSYRTLPAVRFPLVPAHSTSHIEFFQVEKTTHWLFNGK